MILKDCHIRLMIFFNLDSLMLTQARNKIKGFELFRIARYCIITNDKTTIKNIMERMFPNILEKKSYCIKSLLLDNSFNIVNYWKLPAKCMF